MWQTKYASAVPKNLAVQWRQFPHWAFVVHVYYYWPWPPIIFWTPLLLRIFSVIQLSNSSFFSESISVEIKLGNSVIFHCVNLVVTEFWLLFLVRCEIPWMMKSSHWKKSSSSPSSTVSKNPDTALLRIASWHQPVWDFSFSTFGMLWRIFLRQLDFSNAKPGQHFKDKN